MMSACWRSHRPAGVQCERPTSAAAFRAPYCPLCHAAPALELNHRQPGAKGPGRPLREKAKGCVWLQRAVAFVVGCSWMGNCGLGEV